MICRIHRFGYGVKRLYGQHVLIAVGMNNDQIAIKTPFTQYVFDRNGAAFFGMNKYFLVLTSSPEGEYRIISLDTGKVIATVGAADFVELASEYILVTRGSYDTASGCQSSYIIDRKGNIRFETQKDYVECMDTPGEFIRLYRGPYVGIADLNGDWIMKTLSSQLTMDTARKDFEG